MTEEEVKKAEERLIKEANRKSAVERREYERKEYEERCRASERRTARSSILTDILEALKTDFNDKIDEIQNELNEKLEDLYSRNDVAETPPAARAERTRPTRWTIPCPCANATLPCAIIISHTKTRKRHFPTFWRIQ